MTETDIILRAQMFIDENTLLPAGSAVAVGLSGGADSTALLVILSELGYQVRAVHFNHKLRGEESEQDEDGCRRFCEEIGIPYEAVNLQVEDDRANGESLEMAARRLRLKYWYASEDSFVALGHHKDDALETFILNVCRGGNASSLAGLRPKRVFGNVTIIRPLLCLTRLEITQFLTARGISPPGHDSSNDDLIFKRNQVRHRLLPVLEDIAGGRQSLYRTVENLACDSEFIESAVPKVKKLSPEELAKQPNAIAFRMLRNWLVDAGNEQGIDVAVSGKAAERVLFAVGNAGSGSQLIDLDGSHFIRLSGNAIELVAKTVITLDEPVEWNWKQQPRLELDAIGVCLSAENVDDCCENDGYEYFDAGMLPSVLLIRNRADGDTLVPFGSRSPKKLKKLVSDSKLGYAEKRALIVIEAPGNGIIWVPGVKRAEFGRVEKSSNEIVRLAVNLVQPNEQ